MLLDADIMGEKRRLIEWLVEPLYSVAGKVGECGMTNALVHKTGAAIQWARDYGQAHPKMQGIFWIVMSVVFMIVPNLIGRSLTETMGRNVASCISLLVVIPFVFALQKEDARKITSRNLLLMALGGVSAAAVFSLFMGDIK